MSLKQKLTVVSGDTHRSDETPSFTLLPDIKTQISDIPKTRYYGSKRKLLLWLFDTVKGLEFETALDVFGGTASVSRLFQDMRKDVTYNDAFSFNMDVARTVLAETIATDRSTFISFVKGIKPKSGFITKTYKGMYFTHQENRWLDGFMFTLCNSNLSKEERSLYLFALYQACLKKRPFNLFHRANLNLRTRTGIKRSFGNFTTWERSFVQHMTETYDELCSDDPRYIKKANILKPTNAEKLKSGYDLVYIDPPYVSSEKKKNRDDYWKKYHFLEGLAHYEDWPTKALTKDSLKSLLQPTHFNEWSQVGSFKEKLFSLITHHKNSIVVLSYVTDAYPTEVEISDFFNRTFSTVSVHSREYNHALSKKKKRELLFVGRP